MARNKIAPAWRLVDPLTVRQAAAIIAGQDPEDVRNGVHGLNAYDEDGNFDYPGTKELRAIFSALTQAISAGELKAKIEIRLGDFQEDWEKSTVTVSDLNAWLRKRGCPLLFSDGGSEASGPWPWGSYTTRNLELVREVIQEFWSTYDPENPNTAPRKEEVVSWLVNEKMVAKRTAEAIAKICRADDAPTGRR